MFYVYCMFAELRNDCLDYIAVSGDQETAIVLYTVMESDQMCRGCWIYLFLFYLLLLWCISSSYTILWYLNFSSVFHLLQDYFTVVMKIICFQKLIAELLLSVIWFMLYTVIDIELQKLFLNPNKSFLLSVIDLMSVHWAGMSWMACLKVLFKKHK